MSTKDIPGKSEQKIGMLGAVTFIVGSVIGAASSSYPVHWPALSALACTSAIFSGWSPLWAWACPMRRLAAPCR